MKKILIAGTKWKCIKNTYEYRAGQVFSCIADGMLDGYYFYNQVWFKEHFEPTA